MDLGNDLSGRRHLASAVSRVLHGNASVYSKLHIFQHLAFIGFHVQDRLAVFCSFLQLFIRERPYRDGSEQADFVSLFPQRIHSGFRDTRHCAEAGDDDLGILGLIALPEFLVLADLIVGRLEFIVMHREFLGADKQGIDHSALRRIITRLPACRGPGLLLGIDMILNHLRHLDRLHHLAHDAIGQEEHRDPVFLRLLIGKHHDIDRLLDGGRSVGNEVVITVPAAFGGLEIIAL